MHFFFLLTLIQPTVACKKGSTAPRLDCCVEKASLIVLSSTAGEVLLANYRLYCRKHFNHCTPLISSVVSEYF